MQNQDQFVNNEDYLIRLAYSTGYIHSKILFEIPNLSGFPNLTLAKAFRAVSQKTEVEFRKLGVVSMPTFSFDQFQEVFNEFSNDLTDADSVTKELVKRGIITFELRNIILEITSIISTIKNPNKASDNLRFFRSFISSRKDLSLVEKITAVTMATIGAASIQFWTQALSDKSNPWNSVIAGKYDENTIHELAIADLVGDTYGVVICLGFNLVENPADNMAAYLECVFAIGTLISTVAPQIP